MRTASTYILLLYGCQRGKLHIEHSIPCLSIASAPSGCLASAKTTLIEVANPRKLLNMERETGLERVWPAWEADKQSADPVVDRDLWVRFTALGSSETPKRLQHEGFGWLWLALRRYWFGGALAIRCSRRSA